MTLLDLETSAQILGDFAARRGRCYERILSKPTRCALCREEIAEGTVVWTSKRPFASGKWTTTTVCRECPEPFEPSSRASPERLAAFWRRRKYQFERTGRAGRPAVRLTFEELCMLADFRALGFGELRTARAFREATGRDISARTLARFGRE